MTAVDRVKEFVASYKDLSIIFFDSSTHTAQLAADSLGVAVGQIAKSLVFAAGEEPLLVVTCGDKKVDTKALAGVFGCKKVKFASADFVKEWTGFEPGGVSPVGLLQEVPILLDCSLFDYPVVYAAAGTANSALPVAPSRLVELTGGQVVDVCK